VHRVRGTITAGSAVEYERPFALFHVPATSNRVAFSSGVMDRFTIDLEESP